MKLLKFDDLKPGLAAPDTAIRMPMAAGAEDVWLVVYVDVPQRRVVLEKAFMKHVLTSVEFEGCSFWGTPWDCSAGL